MALYFNDKYKLVVLKDKVFIKLVKGINSGYTLPWSSKLSVKKMGPFNIKKYKRELAYKLKLLKEWWIHLIVLVIHLKQVYKDNYK